MSFKIKQIAGDASFRKFYRLKLNKNSKIIILAKKEKYKNLIVYVAVNKYLRSKKILAPKLYSHNYSKGIIMIEDFGDLSFGYALSSFGDKAVTSGGVTGNFKNNDATTVGLNLSFKMP